MEPGNLAVLLAFRQDRVNRLPEQTQRRAYSYAASALRRSGGVENFFAERVSPNGNFKNDHHYHVSIRLVCSNLQHLPPTSLLPPVRYTLYYTAPIHGMATEPNRIRPGRPIMSLLLPILPDGLGLPARHFVFLYIFGWGCA